MSARLISNSIPNLLNGVSQQPDTVKLPNQAVVQENGLSDIISGLGKSCLLYTSPSPRDRTRSRMPSSA